MKVVAWKLRKQTEDHLDSNVGEQRSDQDTTRILKLRVSNISNKRRVINIHPPALGDITRTIAFAFYNSATEIHWLT